MVIGAELCKQKTHFVFLIQYQQYHQDHQSCQLTRTSPIISCSTWTRGNVYFVSIISNCQYVTACWWYLWMSGDCDKTLLPLPTGHLLAAPGTAVLSEVSQDCVHWLARIDRSFLTVMPLPPPDLPSYSQLFLISSFPSQDTTQSPHSDSIIAHSPSHTAGQGLGPRDESSVMMELLITPS